ncbi:hypothetical protein [Psychrobacillus psychrodurans]|uniref:hypothetical protein n=1 Tax=Psychrobacillus psychrodurans TaxID=126157 RepID=UPI0008F23512|nr:hypothetical protein [Psychrobacillus psychrodurans]MCZ8541880.1 hypothetical protein [Psychrobacillus psychrodurans]SFN11213.1 hypothetical protein SAMN05421832_11529 [Psychrobacillus psychrodurans]
MSEIMLFNMNPQAVWVVEYISLKELWEKVNGTKTFVYTPSSILIVLKNKSLRIYHFWGEVI